MLDLSKLDSKFVLINIWPFFLKYGVGADIKAEFIGGQPVMASVSPTPTNPLLASLEAVTIGDVSAYISDFAIPKFA